MLKILPILLLFGLVFALASKNPAGLSQPFLEQQKLILEGEAKVLAEPEPELQIVPQPSIEDQLNDIAEKLSIISQQVAVLAKEIQSEPVPEINTIPEIIEPEPKIVLASYKKAGAPEKTYQKIIISEVQISGENSSKEEFVELYNPNNASEDLSGWYIQKKTKKAHDFSTYAPNDLFSGRVIGPKSYFLVSRINYFSSLANVFVENALSEDTCLVLKNPARDISDKVGWGQAVDYELIAAQNPPEGQSLCRKNILDEPWDADINNEDFEFCTPTPKEKNIKQEPDLSPVIDTTPPTGTLLINNGAEYTNSRNVVLTISAVDDMSEVVEMRIANGSYYYASEPYQTEKNWVLPATTGTKTVRIKFKDSVGNETPTGIPATIIYSLPPESDSGDYSQ